MKLNNIHSLRLAKANAKSEVALRASKIELEFELMKEQYADFTTPSEGTQGLLGSFIPPTLKPIIGNFLLHKLIKPKALPAILSSIPSLMNNSYISGKYGSNQIESIGSKLKERRYSTSFYHGGANGTMGFDAFSQIAGIENYVGLDQYPYESDHDGNWGIFDEPFLQFVVEDLNREEKPFFATVFTLSSHHPYTIPKKYQGKLPKGDLPILESVAYTDQALKSFFKAASK